MESPMSHLVLDNITNYLVLITIYISFIDLIHTWPDGPFYFTQKTVTSVQLNSKFLSTSLLSTTQDRQELCYYAQLESGLDYLDYDNVPEWQEFLGMNQNEDAFFDFGMLCATLPTTYLLARVKEDYIQITSIESEVNYDIPKENINEARFVSRKYDLKEEFRENPFAKLSDEERRNWCHKGRRHVHRMVFVGKDVDEGTTYEFEYESGVKQTKFAISCPTLPQIFISAGPLADQATITLLRSLIDTYDFGMEERELVSARSVPVVLVQHYSSPDFSENKLTRLNAGNRANLCTLARKFASLPFKDTEVPAARWYILRYVKQEAQERVAIFCPSVPSMYLSLGSSSLIKVSLFQNPFEHYHYEMDLHSAIWKMYPNQQEEEEFAKKIQEFPLTSLSKSDRWKICSAARMRISISFHVAILPDHIEPEIMEFHDRGAEIGTGIDVALRCSLRPKMYLRPDKSNDEKIKVAFQKEQCAALFRRGLYSL